jgi:hypothetical protein
VCPLVHHARFCSICQPFYTAAGDAALPSVYLAFACFMASAAMKWVRELSVNSAHVVGIHRVMAALVVIKSVWLAVSSFHWFVFAICCIAFPLFHSCINTSA